MYYEQVIERLEELRKYPCPNATWLKIDQLIAELREAQATQFRLEYEERKHVHSTDR